MEVALTLVLALLPGWKSWWSFRSESKIPGCHFRLYFALRCELFRVVVYALAAALLVLNGLLAPVRWTKYERVVGASLYFGPPLLPPFLLLAFFRWQKFASA